MAEDKKDSIWSQYTDSDKEALEKLAAGYIAFLSRCKTERESAAEAVELAEKAGYCDLYALLEAGEKLRPGDKVYAVNMKKSVVLFNIGEEPLEKGMNILGVDMGTQAIHALFQRLLTDIEEHH